MDKKILLEIGKKKGLTNKEHIEKDYLQDLFLFNLFKKTNRLVFKGGTALYKIYNIQRFSEDLDFNMLENLDAEKIIGQIIKSMKGEFNTRKTKDSLLFKIGFSGVLTKYNTLRIDISIKNRVLQGYDVKNYVPEYIDINPFSLKLLKPEEMIAEKIHSLLARKKARDLYDLFFLLRISKFNKKLVNEKLAIFDMKFSFNELKETINYIENLWEPELKPFVLTDLMSFDTVKGFVLGRIK